MDKRTIKERSCYRELSHGLCNVVRQELICAAISVISFRRNGASFMKLRPISTTPPHLYQLPPASTPALLNPHPYEARTHRQWKRRKGALTQASRVSVHERNSRF